MCKTSEQHKSSKNNESSQIAMIVNLMICSGDNSGRNDDTDAVVVIHSDGQ